MAMKRTKKYYSDRLGELKQEYIGDGWDAVAIDKTRFLYPHGRNLNDALKGSDGTRKDDYLYDGTSLTAVTVATSGIWAGVTNPIEKFFRLADEDKELNDVAAVSDFYQKSTDVILLDFAKSNFYTVMELMFRDMLTYSISNINMDEDDETVFHFTHVPNGQFFIDTDSKGRVSSTYRVYKMRSRDIIEEYGLENVSQNVSEDIQGDKTGGGLHTILHVIERNTKRDIDKIDNLNMPWSSVTIELDQDNTNEKFLRKSGYETKPNVTPRWSVSSGNKYGNGPGDEALGYVKQLQSTTRKLQLMIDKIVSPSLIAPSNGQPVNDGPGEVTRADLTSSGKSQIIPLYAVPPQIEELVALIIDLRGKIDKVFFADLFFAQGQSDPRETATLTIAKAKELLRLLGPIMQRSSTEVLKHLVLRGFAIESRLGRLPDPPKELIGRVPKVEIISSLMKAQELGVIAPIEETMLTIERISDRIPEALDLLDVDVAIREIEQAHNLPIGVIRPEEVVAELRALRLQQAEQAQQAAQTQQAIDGAQQLSQTDLSSDNALNAVIEG